MSGLGSDRLVRGALESGHPWLLQTLVRVSKNALAPAIGYALSRWTALARYYSDGRIEIDNDGAEKALRLWLLGRKNFGSDGGGERVAPMQFGRIIAIAFCTGDWRAQPL